MNPGFAEKVRLRYEDRSHLSGALGAASSFHYLLPKIIARCLHLGRTVLVATVAAIRAIFGPGQTSSSRIGVFPDGIELKRQDTSLSIREHQGCELNCGGYALRITDDRISFRSFYTINRSFLEIAETFIDFDDGSLRMIK